jgi:predicted Rossmann fold nucleotide-binding protein DprA/Smf involved in DNA uptake
MKVIIAGPRDFYDYPTVVKAVEDSGFKISEVVSGGARGVDAMGEKYAADHGIPVKRFDADWLIFGKSAGPRRNKEMARYADALIAIETNPPTSGTLNMIDTAKLLGLRVHVEKTNVPRYCVGSRPMWQANY